MLQCNVYHLIFRVSWDLILALTVTISHALHGFSHPIQADEEKCLKTLMSAVTLLHLMQVFAVCLPSQYFVLVFGVSIALTLSSCSF
jgi:hypothetical protein